MGYLGYELIKFDNFPCLFKPKFVGEVDLLSLFRYISCELPGFFANMESRLRSSTQMNNFAFNFI